jgi:hypothetical protein
MNETAEARQSMDGRPLDRHFGNTIIRSTAAPDTILTVEKLAASMTPAT